MLEEMCSSMKIIVVGNGKVGKTVHQKKEK